LIIRSNQNVFLMSEIITLYSKLHVFCLVRLYIITEALTHTGYVVTGNDLKK